MLHTLLMLEHLPAAQSCRIGIREEHVAAMPAGAAKLCVSVT